MIRILKFYSNNCSPCSMLEKELEGFENVDSFNIMEDFEKAVEYNVRKVPVLVFTKDGGEVGRTVGFKTKQEITYYLESL